jgi:phospholipid/cholesterol/gamma-HCH transport system ATP-binding protein
VTDTSAGIVAGLTQDANTLAPADAEAVRELATLFIDVLKPFGVMMARHLHEQEERLGGQDRDALEATRASCAANMGEILSMLRAGLPAETTETPHQALEYARFQRRRGNPYDVMTNSYGYGVAMFRDVLALELPHRIEDPAQRRRIAVAADQFLFAYIGRILERLQTEFNTDTSAWHPRSSDEILANEASQEAARRFREEQIAQNAWLAESPELSGARAESQHILDEFTATIEDAATDPDLSRRLALAETTVELVLADDPDLAVTLLLDRTPIEVLEGPLEDAEISLRIASFDLAQMCTGDLKLPMAIARGRVGAAGPARKFLRIAPVVQTLGDRLAARRAQTGEIADPGDAIDGDGHERITEYVDEDEEEGGFSPEQRAMLDDAAEFRYHSGALKVQESRPGDFWAVECIDVYKTFGRNRVLRGLDLGIPEGMITVILGPSGTGKSVLINHLIGLMFPEHGDILVHGRSVPNRRRSELFEMRRDFGILFQDGALFGSLNVYDNVAFPLREQTNKSEEEIRRIVTQRLEEVGLGDATNRMPSEISGGMKKRAGFARALVMEPKIVMFDEPDSGLDPVRTALLCDLIRKIHGEHGGTYIVITHDIASARRLGDYIAVLWKGRIVESGDAERMFNSENPFVRQFLSGAADGPLGME